MDPSPLGWKTPARAEGLESVDLAVIVGATTTTAGSYSPSHRGLDGGSRTTAGPSSRSPLLDLSLNPTLVDAVRQLDGTGANGPVGPPRGPFACVTREAGFMAGAGRPTLRVDPAEGQAFRANRLLMPSSAHCTATPVAAWRG
jgi:hypothetical protein